jgi:hypothetical protein
MMPGGATVDGRMMDVRRPPWDSSWSSNDRRMAARPSGCLQRFAAAPFSRTLIIIRDRLGAVT